MCLWITFSQAIALDRFEPYRVYQFCRFGHFVSQNATFGIYLVTQGKILTQGYKLLKNINRIEDSFRWETTKFQRYLQQQ